MASFARPDGDITVGPWTTAAGGTTSLYAQIDETSHGEVDYIEVSLAGPLGIPNQATNVFDYETPNGTEATYRGVYVGGVIDDYHYALLFLPNDMDRHDDAVIVNYFHGASATEWQPYGTLSDDGANSLLNSWLDSGYAVMSYRLGTDDVVDASTVSSSGKWGNHEMREAMLDAFDWINLTFDVHPAGLLFFGFSAGGTNGMNALMAAYAHGIPVAAFAMIDPALNLRSMYGGDTGASAIHHQLDVAYDIPANTKVRSRTATSATSTTLTDLSTGKNWVTNTLNGGNVRIIAGTGVGQSRTVSSHTTDVLTISTPWTVVPDSTSWYTVADVNWIALVDEDLDSGHDSIVVDLALIPDIYFYLASSPTDPTVHKQRNADAFVARIQAAGFAGDLRQTQTSGGHGAASHWRPTEISPFFADALAGA